MKIAIPVKGEYISSLTDADKIAIVTIKNGKIDHIDYVDTIDRVLNLSTHLVVNNEDEDLDAIYDYPIEILLTPTPKMDINQIIEAFLFRELYSI